MGVDIALYGYSRQAIHQVQAGKCAVLGKIGHTDQRYQPAVAGGDHQILHLFQRRVVLKIALTNADVENFTVLIDIQLIVAFKCIAQCLSHCTGGDTEYPSLIFERNDNFFPAIA